MTSAGHLKFIFDSSGIQLLIDGSALSFTQMSSAFQAAILGKLRETYRLVYQGAHTHDTRDIYTRAAWGSTLSNLVIATS